MTGSPSSNTFILKKNFYFTAALLVLALLKFSVYLSIGTYKFNLNQSASKNILANICAKIINAML